MQAPQFTVHCRTSSVAGLYRVYLALALLLTFMERHIRLRKWTVCYCVRLWDCILKFERCGMRQLRQMTPDASVNVPAGPMNTALDGVRKIARPPGSGDCTVGDFSRLSAAALHIAMAGVGLEAVLVVPSSRLDRRLLSELCAFAPLSHHSLWRCS